MNEWQVAAPEKARYVTAAAIGEMLGVAHDHLGKFFENAIRQLHGRLVYP
jgi:hypothetical protein